MKKLFSLLLISFVVASTVSAATTISTRLKGKILLQVEDEGQAWYVNPDTGKRHALGTPASAFALMRELGLGITNTDLAKIQIAYHALYAEYGNLSDRDNDGIPNQYERFFGTNPDVADTDSDSTLDGAEVEQASYDLTLAKRLSGKILLQVEARGEAWYVNPDDLKRYYLGTASDAFNVMKTLGLGISNADLEQIEIHYDAMTTPATIARHTFCSKYGAEYPLYCDLDNDALSDYHEDVLGSNPYKADSDNDGYDDGLEVANAYSPTGTGRLGRECSAGDANCIIDQASLRGDASLCSTLTDEGEEQCRNMATYSADVRSYIRAISSLDPEFCKESAHVSEEATCTLKVKLALAAITLDPNKCLVPEAGLQEQTATTLISTKAGHVLDYCLVPIADIKKDIAVCGVLPQQNQIDSCRNAYNLLNK